MAIILWLQFSYYLVWLWKQEIFILNFIINRLFGHFPSHYLNHLDRWWWSPKNWYPYECIKSTVLINTLLIDRFCYLTSCCRLRNLYLYVRWNNLILTFWHQSLYVIAVFINHALVEKYMLLPLLIWSYLLFVYSTIMLLVIIF